MANSSTELIVFAEGEHEVRTRHGIVCVVVPKDITIEKVVPALTRLVEGRAQRR